MTSAKSGLRRPLRTAFITQWYAPELGDGGVPRNIALALRDQGHEVEVLTGFPNYPEGRLYPGYRRRPYLREVLDGIPVHRALQYFSHDTNGRRRAANYLSFAASSAAVGATRLATPDVSLVYSSPVTAAAAALALRRFRGTPFVLFIQDMWPQTVTSSGFLREAQARRVEPLLQRFCDHVYRRAAAIAVTSPGMADLVAERGVPRDKLHFVPNWANERLYHPAPRDDNLRQALGITRPFTVMYAGNLGEAQGLSVVLEAADALRDRPEIGFALVGSGAAERALRDGAAARSLDNIVFAPPQPVDRMADVLAAGDVQLVSLKDEPIFRFTMPSKVQTLLAAGRPVIGAVAGDAAAVIDESGAGLTVPPGDASALVDAIGKMSVMSANALMSLGLAGRLYYDGQFAASVTTHSLEQLLVAVSEGLRSPHDRVPSGPEDKGTSA